MVHHPYRPKLHRFLALNDLRPVLFKGLSTFEKLTGAKADLWPAWRITHSPEPAWWVGALSAAAAFAQQHDLLRTYRAKLGSIPISELSVAKADAEGRSSTFPIWEIVNELLVARILERALGWQFQLHEPPGRGKRKGDWQFRTPLGRSVFVEVKSLAERDGGSSTGVYSRPSYAPKIRRVLKGAYAQLPDDGRATLVIIVGRELTQISFGIMHGDLFQALYGQMQITFNVMPYDPSSVRLGPSFRDMFVHGTKHRRLGWVAGLVLTGADDPALRFYGIQNPFADTSVAMLAKEYLKIERFVVDSEGHGEAISPDKTATLWNEVAPEPDAVLPKTR